MSVITLLIDNDCSSLLGLGSPLVPKPSLDAAFLAEGRNYYSVNRICSEGEMPGRRCQVLVPSPSLRAAGLWSRSDIDPASVLRVNSTRIPAPCL